ncbi:MAG: hypothetical protein QW328_09045 [Nitrososphaerota archaeon]
MPTTISVRRDNVTELILESVRSQLNALEPGDFLVVRLPSRTTGLIELHQALHWLYQWNASARWMVSVEPGFLLIHYHPVPAYITPEGETN